MALKKLFYLAKFQPKLQFVPLRKFVVKPNVSVFYKLNSNLLEKRKNDFVPKLNNMATDKCCPTIKDKYTRDNYPDEIELIINKQINTELNAGMAYLSMACFFGRSEVALLGCQGYFLKMYQEECDHAMEFVNYQLMRGGHVNLCPVTVPDCQDWGCITKALSVGLEMEKLVKEKLKCVYEEAEKHQDLQTMDFVSSKFMAEQNKSVCEFARLLTRANRMVQGDNVGEFIFDKEMFKTFVKTKSGEKYKF